MSFVVAWEEEFNTNCEVANKRCTQLLEAIETNVQLCTSCKTMQRYMQELGIVFYGFTGCNLQLGSFLHKLVFPWTRRYNENAVGFIRCTRKLIRDAEQYTSPLLALLAVLRFKKNWIPRDLHKTIYMMAKQGALKAWGEEKTVKKMKLF
jgi:hypothetical protein